MLRNTQKNIVFITWTKSHYQMALKILNELNNAGVNFRSKIFCSAFLHDQKNKFCNDTIDRFDEFIFIDDFNCVKIKLLTWKLRALVRKVNQEMDKFCPDTIITFSDNGYIYQDSLNLWRHKAKVVLFHEGYGDYSDPISDFLDLLPYFYIKICLWPFQYKAITRSYTGYYKYSFLLEPSLVHRDFKFEKIKIPSDFIKEIYYKGTVVLEDIVPTSIFISLSGKDWVNDIKLREYICKLFEKLSGLKNIVYIKTSPARDPDEYDFLLDYENVVILKNPQYTSETYCFHDNFKYIITDESSAVVNAIYGGMNKTVFFLNSDIQTKGIYKYDRNYLLDFLIERKIIIQSNIDYIVKFISENKNKSNNIKEMVQGNAIGIELNRLMNE